MNRASLLVYTQDFNAEFAENAEKNLNWTYALHRNFYHESHYATLRGLCVTNVPNLTNKTKQKFVLFVYSSHS